MQMAEDADLDLVEIAPTAQPPVCRIMDFGKFRFQEAKRAHEAKSKQKQIEIKEIVMRPQTDEHDYQIKLRKLREFIAEGDKVKIRLRFRGREMAHQEFGVRQMDRIKADTEEICIIEQYPRLEGRLMVMMLAPKKNVLPVAKPKAPALKPVVAAPAADAKPAVTKVVVNATTTAKTVVTDTSATAKATVTEIAAPVSTEAATPAPAGAPKIAA